MAAGAEEPPQAEQSPGLLLGRGQAIDRFVVLGLLGRGGMGEVYAAYDPELDRKVAIKLLRARGRAGEDGEGAKGRLLREAQAIAKLSHPNVVVVYDVGTFRESVFIAMEFVDGATLGYWLQQQPRSWREVLKIFLAAGQGLAAAHAVGLVHRDFKPDNVMVTKDGQVRVMDFGLARQIGDDADEVAARAARARPAAEDPQAAALAAMTEPGFDLDSTADLSKGASLKATTPSGKYLSVKLTQTGAMLGTPAYMAPEQFTAEATDARTDQFSFCLSLYEGFYGQRPFKGDTFAALMTSVLSGAVSDSPPKTRVPGWLRRVLLRGLQVDPERRYPSMAALLGALQTDPMVRARRIALGVGALMCLSAAGFGIRGAASNQQSLCHGGAQRLAAVWEPHGVSSPRKQQIRRAFTATGKSYAEQAFAGASRFLDEYVGKWLGMYQDACEATQLRGEQSADVLDLRMSCLQERLTSVRALTDLFASADAHTVENAVAAAGALPVVDRCADVALLKAVIPPPRDEATRKRVEVLRGERARVLALYESGHCADAAKLATGLIEQVRATGYQPLLAEALSAAGLMANQCTDMSSAIAWYQEAFSAGVSSHHDAAAAEAATIMGGFLADRAGKVEAGRTWLEIARAMLARIGPHPVLEGWFLNSEALILATEGKRAEAVAAHQKALAAKVKVFGEDHPDVQKSANNLSVALLNVGRLDEALATIVAAKSTLSRLVGAEHPLLAMAAINQCEILSNLRRHADAVPACREAIAIWRQAGSDPSFAAYGLVQLGLAWLRAGKPGEAIAPLEDALQVRTAQNAPAEQLAEARFALARALWSRPAEHERARGLARQARLDYGKAETVAGTVSAIDAWLKQPGMGG